MYEDRITILSKSRKKENLDNKRPRIPRDKGLNILIETEFEGDFQNLSDKSEDEQISISSKMENTTLRWGSIDEDELHHYNVKDYIINKCEFILNNLRTLKILYRVFDDNNKINIYRQSFILAMTAFDAFIKDYAKEVSLNDFEKFVKEINKEKQKIDYSEIIIHDTMEDFRRAKVEEHIEDIALTKLVKIIDKMNSFITNINSYKELLEMISRRNVHIHRGGLCDEKYFETAEGNIYNISLNKYISIDKNYYSNCINTFRKILNNI